jgi:hypothetical protein
LPKVTAVVEGPVIHEVGRIAYVVHEMFSYDPDECWIVVTKVTIDDSWIGQAFKNLILACAAARMVLGKAMACKARIHFPRCSLPSRKLFEAIEYRSLDRRS